MQDLSKTRESLIGAETSKKHLEEHVSDLNRQIQGSEEKLAVYQRRPAADRGISNSLGQDTSHEQQLGHRTKVRSDFCSPDRCFIGRIYRSAINVTNPCERASQTGVKRA